LNQQGTRESSNTIKHKFLSIVSSGFDDFWFGKIQCILSMGYGRVNVTFLANSGEMSVPIHVQILAPSFRKYWCSPFQSQ
jgi:hypothetical protein